MKSSAKDKVGGKVHEMKGKAKQKVGRATNRPDVEFQGTDERAAGQFFENRGQLKKVVGG